MEYDDDLYGDLTCDDCGKKGPDVQRTMCPYASEINNEEIECDLCEDCYYERCMDI
jgi:hypothetical protein